MRRFFLCIGLLALAAVACIASRPSSSLTVDFFDVGQGDAILVQSGSAQMLIDGGPETKVLSDLGRAMPFGDRTIDYVVLTHPHADHFIGLAAVLGRYQVKHVILSGADNVTADYRAFRDAVRSEGADVTVAASGDVFGLGPARFDVLWPDGPFIDDDRNDASVVMRMTAGASRILLMGDATAQVEARLLAAHKDLAAEVLKVGHHGSRFSSSPGFLDAVGAKDAIIEVGRNNYSHPSRLTLVRLMSHGVRIWRTDHDGDIRAVIGEKGIRICLRSLFCR